MKPPQRNNQHHHKENSTQRLSVQQTNMQHVVANQTFALKNEFTLPAIRAVWTVVDPIMSEEDDENRRKRR